MSLIESNGAVGNFVSGLNISRSAALHVVNGAVLPQRLNIRDRDD